MLYDLRLAITYDYDTPAAAGRHLLRVMPRRLGQAQRLVAGSLTVTPKPAEREEGTDFFGNAVTTIAFRAPHAALEVMLQARVQVEAESGTQDLSCEYEGLAAEIASLHSLDPEAPHHFLGTSSRIAPDSAIATWARRSVAPGLSVQEVVTRLSRRLHEEFRFDTEATGVETTPREAFDLRRGVCQDFAHVLISGLRALGVPAGYVSGFLRTEPPQGRERLAGADAMHAWVQAWCGETRGWLGIDPTNDIETGEDHITVALGRDYADVAPVIGVMRTSGGQRTTQAVDVIPVK